MKNPSRNNIFTCLGCIGCVFVLLMMSCFSTTIFLYYVLKDSEVKVEDLIINQINQNKYSISKNYYQSQNFNRTSNITQKINKANSITEIETIMKSLLSDYNLDYYLTSEPYRTVQTQNLHVNLFDLKTNTKKDLNYIKQINIFFNEEIAKYPKDFFYNLQLNSIGIYDTISYEGDNISFYDPNTKSIYINSSGYETFYPHYFGTTIHHEIYHAFETSLQKKYKYTGQHLIINEWTNLNTLGFKYNYDMDLSNLHEAEIPNGFMSAYSTRSQSEDRAEIFGYMMYPSTIQIERHQSDDIVSNKIDFMYDLIEVNKGIDGDKLFVKWE